MDYTSKGSYSLAFWQSILERETAFNGLGFMTPENIACRMMAQAVSNYDIADYTGLSISRVNEINQRAYDIVSSVLTDMNRIIYGKKLTGVSSEEIITYLSRIFGIEAHLIVETFPKIYNP